MGYFSEGIIMLKQDINTRDEALKLLSDQFMSKDLVTSDFYQAIVEREKVTPTGIQLLNVGVAIPHTDSDKVIKPQLGFMSLKNPVEFDDMVMPDQTVKVSLIFMLALKGSGSQVKMLQNLVEVFQDEELISKLIDCDTKEDFKLLMDNLINI